MSLPKARSAVAVLAVAGVVGLASPAPLHAQTTSASVFGSVRDRQGASLPGATVTLTSNTQGDTLATATDREGSYVFPYVRPDTYTLKVTLTGFKTIESTRAVVSANDKFSAGILTLEIGDMQESVTVVARMRALQSTSGERSYTLEDTAIGNIAVNGRSFFGLVGLVPGVLPNANFARDAAPATDVAGFTANGQRPNSNNITVDGITNIDTGNNGGNMATTNLDAVAEFKVLTSSYQAEFGRAVGGQVQVVTKSGTRDFTGSAYWYGRRSDWDANTWINNRAGTAKPDTSRNDFGYTLGGPVYIPGKFNEERKRLFFFFSQEFQRRQDPTGERRVTVPTALERRGDFSQSRDASGNLFPYIRDAATELPCSAADTRGCFVDGGVLGRIPQDRLYPSTLATLNMFPLPNVEGQAGYNFSSQAPSNQPRREELLRLDFHPSDRWRFTGRFMESKDEQEQPYGAGFTVSSNVPIMQGHFDSPGYNWMLSANGILGPKTALEVSVGSAHNSIDIYTTNERLTKSAAGLTDLPLLYPGAVQNDLPPTLLFGGGRVGNPVQLSTSTAPFTNFNTTYDATFNLTRILGSHVVKAGLFFQRSKKDQSAFAEFNGSVSFNNNANNPLDSGHPFANAALGVYDSFQQASAYAKPKWRYTNLEWYIQDNWKVDRRLTLDYGVRFYYLTPQWDVSRQASNFLPERYDPGQAVRLFQPAMVGGRRVAYDPETGQTLPADLIGRVVPKSGDRFNGTFLAGKGIEETLTTGSGFRVSPRVGFAYDVSGKQSAVVRGSFGIFYDRPQGNLVFDLINNPPGISVEQLTWGRFADLGPTSVALNAPIALTPTQHQWELPKVYGWNLGVQAKLPAALTLDVAYVGSESRQLPQTIQINAVPYGAAFLPENQDPTRPPSPTPGATALPADFLRPYLGYGDIGMIEYSAFSNYHALQASLNRRFDKGLLVGIGYTWSKTLGLVTDDFSTGRPDGAEANRRANYSYLGFDRPHNFVVNFVYQTPRVAKGAVGVLANGWQVSGIYRWTSGTPYPITFNIPGIGAANLTGSDAGQNARIVVTGDPGKGWSGDPYRQIDTSVFAPPQPGSLGFESARFFLHGPPINNLDLSVSKSISLGGKRRIELRLDAFNALNHTQFTGVNSQVNFASLTDPRITNLPFDQAGKLVNANGFGTVSGVRSPRQLQVVARLAF